MALPRGQLGRDMFEAIGEEQVADVVQGGAAEGDAHGGGWVSGCRFEVAGWGTGSVASET